jgi:hypothetical protein
MRYEIPAAELARLRAQVGIAPGGPNGAQVDLWRLQEASHAPVVTGVSHGTSTGVRRKCRCVKCREYQRKRVAANRLKRLMSGDLNHGTRSAYDAGCRCDPCSDARRTSYRRLEKFGYRVEVAA